MKNRLNPNPATTIFAPQPHTARSWLLATAAQAALTCLLVALQRHCENTPKETYARMIVTLGVVATWSLALRTIRARLVELLNSWQKASQGLMRKASQSGRHWIAAAQPFAQGGREEQYIKASIQRLRIIAAGLTIPFFIMPLFWSVVSVFLSIKSTLGVDYWMPLACFMLFSACLVAGYFHWAIMPLPATVKVPLPLRLIRRGSR